jgi:hypothetical protein
VHRETGPPLPLRFQQTVRREDGQVHGVCRWNQAAHTTASIPAQVKTGTLDLLRRPQQPYLMMQRTRKVQNPAENLGTVTEAFRRPK